MYNITICMAVFYARIAKNLQIITISYLCPDDKHRHRSYSFMYSILSITLPDLLQGFIQFLLFI